MGSAKTAQLGRYEIVKHLANGGMAQVLLAKATGIEGFSRHVVVKRIHKERTGDPQFVKMFLDEARLAATLHHHNIVQVHDIGQEGGEYFFAMEYIHGEDLRHVLMELSKRKEKLPLEHIVTIIMAAAAALHYAHDMRGPDRKPLGLVHRDVSPANIIVGYDGNVKVVDFGIAKAAALRDTNTAGGVLKGKVSYMAPEQCAGKPIDRRSDVWALGVVLYELTTVRRLFKNDNDFLTMSAIVQGNIPSPSKHRPDLPPALEAIMLKALALSPDDRYASADELKKALDVFAAETSLRTSNSALADYVKSLFGNKPEPWLTEEEGNLEKTIDFDGSASGLAAPPSSAVSDFEMPARLDPTAGAPIVNARTRAITQSPEMRAASLVSTGRTKTPSVQVPAKRPTPIPSSGSGVIARPTPPPTRTTPPSMSVATPPTRATPTSMPVATIPARGTPVPGSGGSGIISRPPPPAPPPGRRTPPSIPIATTESPPSRATPPPPPGRRTPPSIPITTPPASGTTPPPTVTTGAWAGGTDAKVAASAAEIDVDDLDDDEGEDAATFVAVRAEDLASIDDTARPAASGKPSRGATRSEPALVEELVAKERAVRPAGNGTSDPDAITLDEKRPRRDVEAKDAKSADAKADTKTDPKADTKTDPNAESKAEAKADTESDTKADAPKADDKTSDANPATKLDGPSTATSVDVSFDEAATAKPTLARKPSRTLYVGIAAAAIAAVVVLFMVMGGSDDKPASDKPTSAAKTKPAREAAPDTAPMGSADSAPTADTTNAGGSADTAKSDSDSAKPDSDSAKPDSDSAKPDSDSAKPDSDPAKPDTTKTDTTKTDPTKTGTTKTDPTKPDATKTDTTKPDATKTDTTKPNAAQADTTKPTGTKTDTTKPTGTKPPKKKPDGDQGTWNPDQLFPE